jgi:hypothetical protein
MKNRDNMFGLLIKNSDDYIFTEGKETLTRVAENLTIGKFYSTKLIDNYIIMT